MTRLICYLVALAACAAPWRVVAQEPPDGGPPRSARGATWRTVGIWRQLQGLPQNTVRAILQTRDGYLWLGTSSGLARFDGARFTTYDDSTPGYPLRESEVWALAEGGDGALWIGTYGGGVGRLKDGAFTPYGTAQGLANDFVSALTADASGAVWIGTDGGLSRLKDGRFKTYAASAELPLGVVRALHAARDGSVWAGASDGRLVHFRRDDTYDLVPVMPPGSRWDVQAISGGPDGTLWIATSAGVWQLDGKRARQITTADGLSSDDVHDVHADPEGNVWIATEAGLDRFADGALRAQPIEEGQAYRVSSLYRDHDGGLWVGSWSQGLAHLRQSRFVSYTTRDGLAGNYVTTVLQDRRGDVWIGSSSGLSVLRGGRLIRHAVGPAIVSHVSALAETRGGDMVAGIPEGILIVPTGACGACVPRRIVLDADGGVFPRVLYEDRRGVLWIGSTSRGLARYESGRVTWLTQDEGLRHHYIRGMAEDAEGGLFIATRGGGLILFKDGRFRTYDHRDGLANDNVQALHFDRSGALWIATRQGLNRLKDGRLTTITAAQGLFASFVYSFVEDDHGRLWMSCAKGVFSVALQDLHDVADGRRRQLTSIAYGGERGQTGIVGAVGHHPAASRARDGRIWFATADGVAVVDPARPPTRRDPPPVHIENVVVDQRPLAVRSPVRLPAGRRDLVFPYTAVSFLAPEEVRFRFRLEGYDHDWRDAGTSRIAHYTNIPPGEYRFRVTARNKDGEWDDTGASVDVVLPPRLYETRGFFAASALGLLLIGTSLHVLRVRRLATQQVRLERIVELRTHELQDATRKLDAANRDLERRVADGIEALRESERMAAYGQMVAAVAHEVRHPIFALQAAAHVVRDHVGGNEALKTPMRTFESETRRLGVLMSDLLEFARPVGLQRTPARAEEVFGEAAEVFHTEGHGGLQIDVRIAPDLPPLDVDRLRVVQAVLNLMRNAMVHGGNVVRLTLSAERSCVEGRVRLSVADDGSGVPPDLLPRIFEPFVTGGKGTGLGLSVVRRVATAHGGDVSVCSTSSGAVFHLDLPTAVPFAGHTEAVQPA